MQIDRFTYDHRGIEYGVLYLPIKQAVEDFDAMFLKRQQLEREIREYTSGIQQENLLHSLAKLWMFSRDSFVPDEVQTLRAKQRRQQLLEGDLSPTC